MEITALCLRLAVSVLMLLVSQVQRGYHAQKNGSAGWKVVGQTGESTPICETNWETSSGSSCTIEAAYKTDSGKFWCENEKGERSNTVNITVTAGSVILESPVLSVMEGSDVTLRCRNKTTLSNLTADFYKDGLLIRTDSTGEMTIHSVSKSDEGLYKCSMSDSGESPESWLAVTAGSVILESPVLPVMEGSDVTLRCRNKKTPSNLAADFYKDGLLIRTDSTGEMTIHNVSKSDEGLYKCSMSDSGESPESWLAVTALFKEDFTHVFLIRTVFTVLLVVVLVVMGLHHCGKFRGTAKKPTDVQNCEYKGDASDCR